MQASEEQNAESEKDRFMKAANLLYYAKIHAFMAGFTVAIFMIGIVYLFVFKALS